MKIIVTSHGDFCQGILDSYQMIAGENPHLRSISLTDAGIKDFSERFNKLLKEFESEEVLILTDIKGGTPYNEAYSYYLLHEERVRVIAGMNLPMVIEIGPNLLNSSSLADLYASAIEIGQQSITGVVTEMVPENDLEF
ncbi:PTS sugar transporter subunit IIA [Enterococcus xiangfangensis]|uniref:PTS sugar transporter subunit IIA n=1 Tax=Enterococcus xiangfangensis TaxID=1296537 RepID=UPI0010F8D21B|nr:PTS sugar transporter subunit IIA [Enterococcus xiangfangensis]MBM7711180.1 PTS system mannose-specific IIA component/PTS system mannose-specific IIB component [Enterococcus xiangfangensis]NBK09242.1 PTS sugar transporter subunit IIA [Enterococcus asini]